MKTLLAVSILALAAGACRKVPKYDDSKQGSAAPAATDASASAAPAAAPESARPANPTYGADLIRKAQGAAAAGNSAVHQEEKTDAPTQ